MKIYIYSKTTENASVYEEVIEKIKKDAEDIIVKIEHKRNFSKLAKIKKQMEDGDVILIGSLNSLGNSKADMARELEFFIEKEKFLVIASVGSTYQYGLSQPMNRAILTTLLDSLGLDDKTLDFKANKKSKAGRNKIEFPDNWEELYEKWEKDQISSKKFMDESGLKKATFYNMLTEYKQILKDKEEFIEKYNLA